MHLKFTIAAIIDNQYFFLSENLLLVPFVQLYMHGCTFHTNIIIRMRCMPFKTVPYVLFRIKQNIQMRYLATIDKVVSF
jgi:hypothetical protein